MLATVTDAPPAIAVLRDRQKAVQTRITYLRNHIRTLRFRRATVKVAESGAELEQLLTERDSIGWEIRLAELAQERTRLDRNHLYTTLDAEASRCRRALQMIEDGTCPRCGREVRADHYEPGLLTCLTCGWEGT